MADSAFWKNLGSKFKEVHDPKESLRVEWVEPVGTTGQGTWFIKAEDDLHNSVHQFKELATIAGRALAGPSGGDHTTWLSVLTERYHAYNRHQATVTSNDGSTVVLDGGTLHQALRLSWNLCSILEVSEEEREWIVGRYSPELPQPEKSGEKVERSALRDLYLASFPEKIKILD